VCTYTEVDLETVVDQPLERSQSTDHDNSDGETVPKTRETNVAVDSAHSLGSTFTCLSVGIQLADHDIGWVRHDSTTNTSNVTTQERNTGLCKSAVFLLLSAESLVDLCDSAFERREFDHGVRYLTGPEWVQTFVKSTEALLSYNLAPAFTQTACEWRERGLHADLDGLERTQEDIGDEFGSC